MGSKLGAARPFCVALGPFVGLFSETSILRLVMVWDLRFLRARLRVTYGWGVVFRGNWVLFGPFWAYFGPFWAYFGSILGQIGTLKGHFWRTAQTQ